VVGSHQSPINICSSHQSWFSVGGWDSANVWSRRSKQHGLLAGCRIILPKNTKRTKKHLIWLASKSVSSCQFIESWILWWEMKTGTVLSHLSCQLIESWILWWETTTGTGKRDGFLTVMCRGSISVMLSLLANPFHSWCLGSGWLLQVVVYCFEPFIHSFWHKSFSCGNLNKHSTKTNSADKNCILLLL
jgi:hypothetical protein